MRRLLFLLAILALTVASAACGEDDVAEPGTPLPDDTAAEDAAGADAETVTLTATLTGAEEVPGPGADDGSGSAEITVNGTEVCFDLAVDGIEPAMAAHIHEGPFGEAGAVVITLDPAPAEGESSGCAEGDQTVVDALLEDPSAFYVNVHNADFPDGAVRGQLG